MNGALLELNAIKTELPRSWFIDQSVQQDSTLYVGTPVDPLFLVLPLLTTARDKFTDLAQLLASRTDRPHLRYLSKCNIDPTPICDINGLCCALLHACSRHTHPRHPHSHHQSPGGTGT